METLVLTIHILIALGLCCNVVKAAVLALAAAVAVAAAVL